MIIRPGEFWIAEIQFTDGSTSKKRPVLVLWLDGADVVVAVVTSARPRTLLDVPLVDWNAAGLLRESTVRLSRLDCIHQSLLTIRTGCVSTADGERIKQVWASHVRLQF